MFKGSVCNPIFSTYTEFFVFFLKRHFHWMARHGVDGAFLQRFAGQCDLESGNEGIRRIRDEVGERVREAAEQEGRVFAIMWVC